MPYKAGTYGEKVTSFELLLNSTVGLTIRVKHKLDPNSLKKIIDDVKTSFIVMSPSEFTLNFSANFMRNNFTDDDLYKKITILKALFLPKDKRDYINYIPRSISTIYEEDLIEILTDYSGAGKLKLVDFKLDEYIRVLALLNIATLNDEQTPSILKTQVVLRHLKTYTDADTDAREKLSRKIEALKGLAK